MMQPTARAAGDERPHSPRTLLLIAAEPSATMRAEVAAGRQPMRDYDALRAALTADMLTPTDATRTATGRLLSRLAGRQVALAWAGYRQRRRYDTLYSDSEGVGLPLALLLWLGARRRPRHVVLTHLLSPLKKRLWFRLGVARAIDLLIVHSSAQYVLATERLRVPAARVALLPYFADERFWHPLPASEAQPAHATHAEGESAPPMICAVGLEFRDYATLAQAVRGLPVQVCIGASSHWSHHSAFAGAPDLPPNVDVRAYGYEALRALYAAARFVVVPLREGDNQAGITTLLEGMAMGKAVIVSATHGQTDVLRDPRPERRAGAALPGWRGFLDAPADAPNAAQEMDETLGRLPTGLYVTPGDPADLRAAIERLLAHPEEAEAMGQNGRRVVEAAFGLTTFAQRFAAAIEGRAPQVRGASTDADTARLGAERREQSAPA